MEPFVASTLSVPHVSGRSPVRSLTGVQVLATGSYVPEQVVTNDQLRLSFGIDPEWIVQRTGILERRHAAPEMATSDLAVAAGRRCIENAGVRPDEIDLLLVGTFTPDMPLPSTACLVQDRLGIRAPAMDVQAACAGFIYALVTGMQFVATGCSRLALVIGADCNSRIINPHDRRTFPLFGDGAGAVLLGSGNREQGLLAYTLGSDGSGADLLSRPMGGSRAPLSCSAIEQNLQYIRMDGRAVFKWAVRVLTDTIRDVLSAAGMGVEDIDLLALHQANIRIIDSAVADLGIDPRKVFINLQRYGNTSAGSIPLVLDEAAAAGRIERGSKVMISGFGAGLAWGTALLRW
ncbi:MAG: ketoacyl-ACP synthase III [Planctomycetes bacterium]|nr:ketoacyl-ACP synthase III [Planctomycetota bacterium]